MTRSIPFALSAIGITACVARLVTASSLATVTLLPLDSFGGARQGCQVVEFVTLDDLETDYKMRFEGLRAKNIPFGADYRTHIKCDDQRGSGPFFVTVNRSDQFIVLGSWLHRGDYVTGPSPRLTVSVAGTLDAGPSPKTWVKIVGVYLDHSETGKVDPESHSAMFYDLVPGRYLVLILSGKKLSCTKQVDFFGAHTGLDISISQKSCTARESPGIQIVQ